MRATNRWLVAACMLTAACVQSTESPPVSSTADPEDRYVRVNGARLHYIDWGGSGPVLVLAAGLSHTARSFAEIAPAFTDRFRVLSVTRRGHGSSDSAPPSITVDMIVDDLAAFTSLFSDGPAVMVGMSFGGLEISRLARRYPKKVRALVFLDAVYDFRKIGGGPPLPGFDDDSTYSSYAALDSAQSDMAAEFWSERLQRHIHSQVYTREDGQVAWHFSRPTAARYEKIMKQWDPADYASITAPTLVVRAFQEDRLVTSLTRRGYSDADVAAVRAWARNDDVNKQLGITLMRAAVPDVELVELHATDHWLQFHKPAQVIETMRLFLSRIGS